MTRDDIIRMARESGLGGQFGRHFDECDLSMGFIERFAKLVAEAEREACAKVCETLLGAKIFWTSGTPVIADPSSDAAINECAELIRAMGKSERQ